MANKRQLKKAIQNACGEMAGQCLMAQEMIALNVDEVAKWDDIIVDIASLQADAVARVGRKFDKPQEKELTEFFRTEAEKIAQRMNDLLPKKK